MPLTGQSDDRILAGWRQLYTTYEDDGKYIHNQTEEDEKYGTIDHVSYGSHVSTTYTSSVKEGKAILTAECSKVLMKDMRKSVAAHLSYICQTVRRQ